jgi:hypothetical protein
MDQNKSKFNPVVVGVVIMLMAGVLISQDNLTARYSLLNPVFFVIGMIGFVMAMVPLVKIWIGRFKNKK